VGAIEKDTAASSKALNQKMGNLSKNIQTVEKEAATQEKEGRQYLLDMIEVVKQKVSFL